MEVQETKILEAQETKIKNNKSNIFSDQAPILNDINFMFNISFINIFIMYYFRRVYSVGGFYCHTFLNIFIEQVLGDLSNFLVDIIADFLFKDSFTWTDEFLLIWIKKLKILHILCLFLMILALILVT